MTGASIDISDRATPALQKMRATLAERLDINRALAAAVQDLCREYVIADQPHRHATAEKLGANPTGFLGYAAEAISASATADVAIVDFTHPWFSAVGHDVHIAPGPGKKFLAIPIAAPAYGVRLLGHFNGGRFFRGSSGGLFYGMPYPGNEKVLQPLYVLVPFVDQKQDRTRLPSDDEIKQCALAELRRQIQQRLAALNTL